VRVLNIEGRKGRRNWKKIRERRKRKSEGLKKREGKLEMGE